MEKLIIKLLRLWNGKEKLALAFWGVYIPVIIINATTLFFGGSFFDDHPIKFGLFFLVQYALLKTYSLVTLWRCTPNVSPHFHRWSTVAKVIVILNCAHIVLFLIIFALSFVEVATR